MLGRAIFTVAMLGLLPASVTAQVAGTPSLRVRITGADGIATLEVSEGNHHFAAGPLTVAPVVGLIVWHLLRREQWTVVPVASLRAPVLPSPWWPLWVDPHPR